MDKITASAASFLKPGRQRRRLIMTTVGVMMSAIAVAFFKCSLFSVDPFQCFSMGTWGKLFPMISYGTYYMALSLVMLAIDLFLDRHYIGLATFINLFLLGYVIDFAVGTLNTLCPDPSLPVRIAFLAFGVLVICVGASLYMTADLGVSVYDEIPIVISNRSPIPFRFARIGCDLICVAIGTVCVLLGGGEHGGVMPGLGTIICAFFMGPLIDLFNRKLSRPLLEKAEK